MKSSAIGQMLIFLDEKFEFCVFDIAFKAEIRPFNLLCAILLAQNIFLFL